MSFPTTRQEFTDRCLRKLGYPVIEINVDDDQVADRIDDAIQEYWKYHYDGVEKIYMRHQVSAGDISNGWIDIPDPVIGVNRIFPVGESSQTVNMFDLRYQLRLHDLYDFSSVSYVNYEITMMHLATLEMLFSGIPGVRFNTKTHKLYIDIDWSADINVGEYFVIEAYRLLDPDEYTAVWKDRWLFDYATALIKQQWGANMSKFNNVQLVGGIVLDGKTIWTEATEEIKELETKLRDTYEEPPRFLIG